MPALDPQPAVGRIEQKPREWRPDHARNRYGDHERGHRAGAFGFRHPLRQVIDDAREKPGFGDAEQEAREAKRGCALDERGRHGEQSPGDHDAGDPSPRAELRERDVARHLGETIAGEEDARDEAEGLRSNAEFGVHGERREADVHAIEVSGEIAEHEKGQQVTPDLGRSRRKHRGVIRCQRTAPASARRAARRRSKCNKITMLAAAAKKHQTETNASQYST